MSDYALGLTIVIVIGTIILGLFILGCVKLPDLFVPALFFLATLGAIYVIIVGIQYGLWLMGVYEHCGDFWQSCP